MKLIKIEKKEYKRYNGLVYDLTVKDNHSYNINGIIVHNSACLTTEQTSLGYPLGSLIRETYEISLTLKNPAKIVADGGIRKYADIIKALSLGADYVMVGSLLNKSFESSGEFFKFHREYGYLNITKDVALELFNNKVDIYKQYKGMSTKVVQQILGNEKLKTSEGIIKYNKVEYKLESWIENLTDYLKSTMSYCGKDKLIDFTGQVEFTMITNNAFLRYNK